MTMYREQMCLAGSLSIINECYGKYKWLPNDDTNTYQDNINGVWTTTFRRSTKKPGFAFLTTNEKLWYIDEYTNGDEQIIRVWKKKGKFTKTEEERLLRFHFELSPHKCFAEKIVSEKQILHSEWLNYDAKQMREMRKRYFN